MHAYSKELYNVEAIASEQLSVHFLQMKELNGDAVYIKAGDTDVLIDAGSDYSAALSVKNYVNRFCTDGKLEYVVVTHGDFDHYAGFLGTAYAESLFDSFDVEVLIQFSQTNSDGENFRKFCAARDRAAKRGMKVYNALDCCKGAEGKRVFTLADGITMEVLYHEYYENFAEENNYSVCLLVTQGDNRYLFTGDLEEEGELSLLEHNPDLQNVTLYKAGHHGSENSSGEELLKRVRPQYVCVCAVAGSFEYTEERTKTFPSQNFLNRVSHYTDNVYVTNYAVFNGEQPEAEQIVKPLNGDIVFACTDGKTTMYFSQNDDKLKDSDWLKENRDVPWLWRQK